VCTYVNETFPPFLTILYYFKNCQAFLAYSVHTHINTYVHTYMPIHTHNHIYIHRMYCIVIARLQQHVQTVIWDKKRNKLYFIVTLLSGYILQNLFNRTSDYSEILITWHSRKVVPRLVIFLFTRKIFISEIGKLMRHVYKGYQESASTVVVSAHSLSPILSTLSALSNPDNRKDKPDDTEPVSESRNKQACL